MGRTETLRLDLLKDQLPDLFVKPKPDDMHAIKQIKYIYVCVYIFFFCKVWKILTSVTSVTFQVWNSFV